MALKRRFSLKRNKEFRYVYRAGKSVACRSLVLVYKRSSDDGIKVGFSVSKRIGGSVVRNKVKRRLKEAFYQTVAQRDVGVRLIFIAREPILREDFSEMKSSMRYLLKKAELDVLYKQRAYDESAE